MKQHDEMLNRAKKIFARGKILEKTCCTNSTISYNYQQVTSVFARFNKRT